MSDLFFQIPAYASRRGLGARDMPTLPPSDIAFSPCSPETLVRKDRSCTNSATMPRRSVFFSLADRPQRLPPPNPEARSLRVCNGQIHTRRPSGCSSTNTAVYAIIRTADDELQLETTLAIPRDDDTTIRIYTETQDRHKYPLDEDQLPPGNR
ncbi:hypothetical protein K523DRAFT_144610 [Schizophyllum commune Tattone D]|nr:hypothetical protein K523DRAFT_144610 [Schizophyllum commune Tattone D]